MGYFDGLTASGFKKLDNGKTAYYPNGIFGKGYIIDDASCSRIQKFLKYFFIVYFIGLGLCGGFLGAFVKHSIKNGIFGFILFMLLSLITYYGFYLIKIKPLLTTPVMAGTKLTIKDNIQNMSVRLGQNSTLIYAVMAFLLVVMCTISFLVSDNKIVSILGLIFFGFCFIMGVYMYWFVSKSENNQETESNRTEP